MRGVITFLCLLFSFLIPAHSYASSLEEIAIKHTIEEIAVTENLNAWLIEEHYLPIISLNIAITKSGTAYNPKGQEGISSLITELLDEGSGTYTAHSFKSALESHAISLQLFSDSENIYIQIKTLKKHLDKTLSLLSSMLTAPHFTPEAMKKGTHYLKTILEKEKGSASAIARNAWYKAFFKQHPYARSLYGTEAALSSLTADDLHRYVKTHFTQSNLHLSIVGDITKEELQPLLHTYLGQLPADSPVIPSLPPTPKAYQAQTEVIDKPFPQAVVYFGLPFINRDHPDFYAAYVANYILGGGGFESRLMHEIREKKGLVYSISSSIQLFEKGSIWQGAAATDAKRIGETVRLMKQQIKNVQKYGVTQKELDAAKQYIIMSFPLKLERVENVAQFLTTMQLYGLGKDYLQKRHQYISEVTLEQTNRVIASWFDTEKLLTVVVGNQPNMKTKNNTTN